VVEFAQNMGVSWKRVLDGDRQALDSLAHWGGLTSAEVDTLQSWSGEPIGEVRLRFGGEVFILRALRNPTMRWDWQLRVVALCLKHRHLLVPFWT
jgi:hypothetical protein